MNEIVPSGDMERQIAAAMDSSALAVISRQEIDVQIVTAHRFPRSLKNFRGEVADMTTLNEEVAAECSYALPRQGKVIEGPSARFAEILLSAWGNCRAAARVVNDDGTFITAQGIFHDLQKNSAVAFEVRRRITDSKGRRYSDDMIAVTGNAASSIALRNAILKGIPKALWSDLWSQARKTAVGDHKTLANRRADALKLFQNYGVSQDQLCEFLQIKGPEEITTDHLGLLRGMATAFKEGDTTPEEVFARPSAPTLSKQPPKSINDKLKDFGGADQSLPSAAAEAPAQGAGAGEPASSSSSGDAGTPSQEKPDPLDEAHQAGRKACRDGHLLEAMPQKYARYTKLKAAYKDGYQQEGERLEAEMNQ